MIKINYPLILLFFIQISALYSAFDLHFGILLPGSAFQSAGSLSNAGTLSDYPEVGMQSNGALIHWINRAEIYLQDNLVIIQLGILESSTPPLAFISSNHSFSGSSSNANPSVNPISNYFSYDGSNFLFLGTGTNWSTNFDTTLVQDGNRTFYFRAVTASGETNTFPLSITVDNSPPVISITNIPGDLTIEGPFIFKGILSDPHSGFTFAILAISNTSGPGFTNLILLPQSGLWDGKWNNEAFESGDYQIILYVQNMAGLTASTVPLIFNFISIFNKIFDKGLEEKKLIIYNTVINKGGTAEIFFYLEKAQIVDCLILSPTGHRVHQFEEKHYEAGMHFLAWENIPEDIAVNGYYALLRGEDWEKTLLLIVK